MKALLGLIIFGSTVAMAGEIPCNDSILRKITHGEQKEIKLSNEDLKLEAALRTANSTFEVLEVYSYAFIKHPGAISGYQIDVNEKTPMSETHMVSLYLDANKNLVAKNETTRAGRAFVCYSNN